MDKEVGRPLNILLLRGLVREQRHWMGFDKYLENKIPGSKVYALDFPGIGTEWGRLSPNNIAGILEDTRNRWLKLKESSEGPWVVVSLSLGAMVALRWVETYQDDFQKIVIMNTSAANLSAPYKRFNVKIIPKFLKLWGTENFEDKERLILEFTTSTYKNVTETAKLWSDWAREKPLNFTVLMNQLWAAMGFKAPKKIAPPLLCLVSEHDSLTKSSCTKVIAKRLGAPCEIHLSAGHDMTLDAPEWVVEKIMKFVG